MDEAVLLPQCVDEDAAVEVGAGCPGRVAMAALPEVVDCTTTDEGASEQSVDALNSATDAGSMSFNLQTSGLAVQINTKMSANVSIVELQSKLELALLMLGQTEARLEAAHRKIGFLQARLETQAQQS